MSDPREQAFPVNGFRGIDQSSPLGYVKPGFTRSLRNVYIRNGAVFARGGVDWDETFSAVMSENIDQLAPYTATGGAVTLLRMGATKVEKSTGGAWSNITGTSYAGATADIPQYAQHRATIIFTTATQPRKWTGSGNTSVLGGDPPFAKVCLSYSGFFFLFNVSDDGVTFLPRVGRYTQDYDGDWSLCTGNELQFNETAGDVLAAGKLGRQAAICKSDGVVLLRDVGGQIRFSQEPMKFDKGIIAPASLQSMSNKGLIMLASDYQLYIITEDGVTPLPPNVTTILKETLSKAQVATCRSAIAHNLETYYLFYPITSSGLTGRIQLNYRTGEFTHSIFEGHAWRAAASFKWTTVAEDTIVGAVAKTPYYLDTTTVTDEVNEDVEVSLSRYYDTDWQHFAGQADTFTGATLVLKKQPNARVAVSVAVDGDSVFRYRKVYKLRPLFTTDDYIFVRYDVSPIDGEWFNVRVELLPSLTKSPELQGIFLHFLPDQQKDKPMRSASTTA